MPELNGVQLATALLILMMAIFGYHRGMVRMLFSILSIPLSLILTNYLFPYAQTMIGENQAFRGMVEEKVQDIITDYLIGDKAEGGKSSGKDSETGERNWNIEKDESTVSLSLVNGLLPSMKIPLKKTSKNSGVSLSDSSLSPDAITQDDILNMISQGDIPDDILSQGNIPTDILSQGSIPTGIPSEILSGAGGIDGIGEIEGIAEAAGISEKDLYSQYNLLNFEEISESIAGEISEIIIKTMIFAILFAIIKLILKAVYYTLSRAVKFPGLSFLNRIFGAMVGICEAILYIWIGLIILSFLPENDLVNSIAAEFSKEGTWLWVLKETNLIGRSFLSMLNVA